MTKKLLFFLLVAIVVASCTALGTKTLYKSEATINIKKLAFAKLDGSTIVAKIFPQTNYVFGKGVTETFKAYNIDDVTPINREFPIVNPDKNTIAQICKQNNFDGLVVSHLKFINHRYTMYMQTTSNWNTEVEMKLFDKDGNLVLAVLHNTSKGNSYVTLQTADRTIYDGAEGAVKRLAKELGLSNQR
jgi:hypothetical protein